MNNFKKHLRLSLSLILLASLLLSLLSCGKKAYYEDYNFDADYITDSAAPQEPNLNGNSYTSGDYSFSTKSTSYSYESSQKAEDESAGSLAIEAETQRKIIYSSYFSIQTTNFDEASAALDRLCEKYGAYYERSETFGNAESGDRSGSLRFAYLRKTIKLSVPRREMSAQWFILRRTTMMSAKSILIPKHGFPVQSYVKSACSIF